MTANHCFVLQVAASTWSYSLKLKYQLQLRASSWVGTSSSRSNLKYKTPFGLPERQFWASARSWISLPAVETSLVAWLSEKSLIFSLFSDIFLSMYKKSISSKILLTSFLIILINSYFLWTLAGLEGGVSSQKIPKIKVVKHPIFTLCGIPLIIFS